jgi:uncharacterized protein YjbI with pentapeptide repeats
MADEQHVKILRQGVSVWNEWREGNPNIIPDLTRSRFNHEKLSGINFSETNLAGADLSYTDLCDADLCGAWLAKTDFAYAVLDAANLTEASLLLRSPTGDDDKIFILGSHVEGEFVKKQNIDDIIFAPVATNFFRASLRGTKFCRANLYNANMKYADLEAANLRDARLTETDFRGANLMLVDFEGTWLNETIFVDTNLKNVSNLESCVHGGPSIIDHRTLLKSGSLPKGFLRGIGLSDTFIEYIPSLFGLDKAIQFYSCFISYSHKDEEFAKLLHADLQDCGVRCWFAPENLKIGDKLRYAIDESIRVYDRLLLILSAHSIQSSWVEHEVEAALDKETERGKTVLFPIRLHDAILEHKAGWSAKVKRERHIGDFREWKNHDVYQLAFKRLLRDLKADARISQEYA